MSFNTEMMSIPGEAVLVAADGVEFHVDLPGESTEEVAADVRAEKAW